MTLKISKPLSKILRAQKKFGRLVEASLHLKQKSRSTQRPRAAAPRAALMAVAEFGSNPGRLSMKLFVPPRVAANPALVVILHGCRQTPESLADASGFSRLATERGFILLYPRNAIRTTRSAVSTGFARAQSHATAVKLCRSDK
uniref:PHB depolymerase family esterase n=1 Tax=Ensifer sp. Root423 TaxID=1736534 RepID=UPI003299A8BE